MPAAALYSLADSADPTADMLKKIGDLSKIQLSGGKLLLWIYIHPRKSKGGIILTDKEVTEDRYQGAVGYVLKRGPFAFQDDVELKWKFGGFDAKVGDWVVMVPGEGKRVQINGCDCRIIEDALIQMVIPSADLITHRQ